MEKTERLGLVLTPDEKTAVERLALREGESMAVVVRRLIRAAARELLNDPAQLEPAGTGAEVTHGS